MIAWIKDLEKAVDRAVFGSNDPEKIRKIFLTSGEAWLKERSTLGGYLRYIRSFLVAKK